MMYSSQIQYRFFQSFLIALSLVFTSCNEQNNAQDQPKAYYDLKGFIEGQINQLNAQKPLTSKTLRIGKELNAVSSREIDWKKELELFIQADINKPAYRQSYTVTHPDSLSYQYVIKNDQELPVQYLKIRLNKAGGDPVEIKALIQSENKLYKSKKEITLTCITNHETCRINNYHIRGFQKLATMEMKQFDVRAKVNY